MFLGGLKYSKAIQGSLTKFGVSFMSVGVDRILSLVLGFATSADIVKKVYPHENFAQENFRNFLSKSGEDLSQIRNVKTVSLDELSVGQNTYRILPEGYAEQYLPTTRANQNKYVEVNVYVDPAIKNKVTIKPNGTFVLQDGTQIAPFILNKTLSDGHTEINVHFGEREGSVFSSSELMTSGRVGAGANFELGNQINASLDKSEAIARRKKEIKHKIEQVNQATNILEERFLQEMQSDETSYKKYLAIEQSFRVKLDSEEPGFMSRIEALSAPSYDETVFEQIESSLQKKIVNILGKNIDIPKQILTETIFSALVKARMRRDAIKQYGEDWEKKDYTEIIAQRKDSAVKHTDKWNKTLSEKFGVQDSEFLNPETALKSVTKRDDTDVKNVSGGWGYIMGPNGEPVILSQLQDTQIMHPREKIVNGSDGSRYRLITGYLKECRNPMFVMQKIEKPVVKTENVSIASDQEATLSNIGVNVNMIDLNIGFKASPPTVSSKVSYETKSTQEKTQRQEIEREKLLEYKTETLKEIREEEERTTLHDEKVEVVITEKPAAGAVIEGYTKDEIPGLDRLEYDPSKIITVAKAQETVNQITGSLTPDEIQATQNAQNAANNAATSPDNQEAQNEAVEAAQGSGVSQELLDAERTSKAIEEGAIISNNGKINLG